jgi:hypothetical protein
MLESLLEYLIERKVSGGDERSDERCADPGIWRPGDAAL